MASIKKEYSACNLTQSWKPYPVFYANGVKLASLLSLRKGQFTHSFLTNVYWLLFLGIALEAAVDSKMRLIGSQLQVIYPRAGKIKCVITF